MSKYKSHQSAPPPRPYELHPIWRGIGCILLLISPPVAYAAAHLLIDMNLQRGWYPIPREFMNTFVIPGLNYPLAHFYGSLALAAVLLVLGMGVLMFLYSIMYSVAGPGHSPVDAAPVRERPKAATRHRK